MRRPKKVDCHKCKWYNETFNCCDNEQLAYKVFTIKISKKKECDFYRGHQ